MNYSNKRYHSLLYVFIMLFFIRVGISLLNIRFPGNLDLNMLLILSTGVHDLW